MSRKVNIYTNAHKQFSNCILHITVSIPIRDNEYKKLINHTEYGETIHSKNSSSLQVTSSRRRKQLYKKAIKLLQDEMDKSN